MKVGHRRQQQQEKDEERHLRAIIKSFFVSFATRNYAKEAEKYRDDRRRSEQLRCTRTVGKKIKNEDDLRGSRGSPLRSILDPK